MKLCFLFIISIINSIGLYAQDYRVYGMQNDISIDNTSIIHNGDECIFYLIDKDGKMFEESDTQWSYWSFCIEQSDGKLWSDGISKGEQHVVTIGLTFFEGVLRRFKQFRNENDNSVCFKGYAICQIVIPGTGIVKQYQQPITLNLLPSIPRMEIVKCTKLEDGYEDDYAVLFEIKEASQYDFIHVGFSDTNYPYPPDHAIWTTFRRGDQKPFLTEFSPATPSTIIQALAFNEYGSTYGPLIYLESLVTSIVKNENASVLVYVDHNKLIVSNSQSVECIKVYNPQGILVQEINNVSDVSDISDLASGMYIVVVYQKDHTEIINKILIK